MIRLMDLPLVNLMYLTSWMISLMAPRRDSHFRIAGNLFAIETLQSDLILTLRNV